MSLCPDCGKEHYDIVGEGVAVLIPENIKGCPAFKRVAERKITMSEPKTLREVFEELSVESGLFKRFHMQWNDDMEMYSSSSVNMAYKGFLLGKRRGFTPDGISFLACTKAQLLMKEDKT